MYNKVILIGRLTADPVARMTQKQTSVTSFTLAVDRPKSKNQDPTLPTADFINIVAWSGLADTCHRFLKKGQLVCVEGRLQIRSFQGNDGTKKWITEVVASDMRMFPRSMSDGQGASQGSSELSEGHPSDILPPDDAMDFGTENDLPF